MFYDNKETFTAEERQRYLLGKLRETIGYARENTEYYRERLQGINPDSIRSIADLAHLPVTRKSELILLQKELPPFAGINGVAPGSVARMFQSPGPIQEPEGKAEDWWRMGRAFYAAGFRAGNIVHNTLSYHLSPGGFIIDSGARACGCAVIPAGPGQTEQQLQVLKSLQPDGYAGTPSFLNILLEKADTAGQDVSHIKKALVTGEGLPEALRQQFVARGIQCLQAYATADVGLIAYESERHEGMIVAEDIILEIVRPGTGEPIEPGGTGEILVTVFNLEYPLIRFATGDLTAILPGESSCGRTNQRIKGWLGRTDQSTKIKGLFVHSNQVYEVVRTHKEISKSRLIVEQKAGRDMMTLLCEAEAKLDFDAIKKTLRSVCRLKGEVKQVEQGTLKNDGLIIEDLR